MTEIKATATFACNVHCPGKDCGLIMLNSADGKRCRCVNSNCEFFDVVFKRPSLPIVLEKVEIL